MTYGKYIYSHYLFEAVVVSMLFITILILLLLYCVSLGELVLHSTRGTVVYAIPLVLVLLAIQLIKLSPKRQVMFESV